MTLKAQHPIYAPGVSQQIRDEYEAVRSERDAWQSAAARAETDAERFQVLAEELVDRANELVVWLHERIASARHELQSSAAPHEGESAADAPGLGGATVRSGANLQRSNA